MLWWIPNPPFRCVLTVNDGSRLWGSRLRPVAAKFGEKAATCGCYFRLLRPKISFYLLCLRVSLLTWWAWPAAPRPGCILSSVCLSSSRPPRSPSWGLPVASACASSPEMWRSPPHLSGLNNNVTALQHRSNNQEKRACYIKAAHYKCS